MKDLTEAEIEERREAYLNRGLDVDGRRLQKGAEKNQIPAGAPTGSRIPTDERQVNEEAQAASLAVP